MGLSADAELIFGIPVQAYNDDEEGTPTQFWAEEDDDWRQFEGDLEICQYGHYENPDGLYAILTTKRVKLFRADCWEAVKLSPSDLNVADKALSKANDEARAEGLDVNFYSDASWCLVASYG